MDNAKYGVDGVFDSNGRPTVVQVKIVTPRWRRSVESAAATFRRVLQSMKPTPGGMFVGIVDGFLEGEPPSAVEIARQLRNHGLDVDVRVFDLAALERKYGFIGDDVPR